MRRLLALVVFLQIPLAVAGQGLEPALQDSLARRFRPYIKTTTDEGRDEPFHPTNWQWYIARADLIGPDSNRPVATGEMLERDHLQLVLPSQNANLTVAGAGAVDPRLALPLRSTASRAGEPWSEVINRGHGIYAHLEEVCDTPPPTPAQLHDRHLCFPTMGRRAGRLDRHRL